MLTFAKYQEINLGGHTTRTGFNFKYGGRLPKLNFYQEKALADLHVQELELVIPINVDSLQLHSHWAFWNIIVLRSGP